MGRHFIKRLSDFGDLIQGDMILGQVFYEINIFQEFIDSTPGLKNLEGTIVWRGEGFFELNDHVTEQFTLRLEDDQELQFQLGTNGSIHPQSDIDISEPPAPS